jgi:tripartite-type tricarboxylate transporter receptor subunit TctC
MKLLRRDFLCLAGGAVAAFAKPAMATAQTYPARPVRVIVPFPPGGGTDIFARLAAQKLAENLGAQFYVDNVAGGGGNIGTGQAARAAPDGYTILFAFGSFVVNPSFFAKVPYDPIQDFAPVTLSVMTPTVLTVNPSVPAKTVDELVELIRVNPGKYSYSTGGAGTQPHLAGEQLRLARTLDVVHVPYGGAGPSNAAVVAGHTPIGLTSLASVVPYIKDGKLRALAVTSKTRSQILPDVPTMAEAGYPDIIGDSWVGVLVPTGTPIPIIALLHREMANFVAMPDTRTRLATLGYEAVASAPDEFAQRIRSELGIWRNVIQAANISPQ